MVKIVNFLLLLFYHNFFFKGRKEMKKKMSCWKRCRATCTLFMRMQKQTTILENCIDPSCTYAPPPHHLLAIPLLGIKQTEIYFYISQRQHHYSSLPETDNNPNINHQRTAQWDESGLHLQKTLLSLTIIMLWDSRCMQKTTYCKIVFT